MASATKDVSQLPTGGTRWIRADLHLHTPGVSSFTCPSGVSLDSPAGITDLAQRYVERLVAAGIKLAAITDYNGVRISWFEAIRNAAAGTGVVILPGAELSLQVGKGLHVLAVFEEAADPVEINEYLRSLDVKPGRQLFSGREHDEIDLRLHLNETLSGLRERFNCLLIPAHATGKKGLISAMGAMAAAQLVQELDSPDGTVGRYARPGRSGR